MDRNRVSVVVMSIVIVGLAVTAVFARSWTTTTPLYTYRMEQASDKMHFLPTEINEITYNTEKGYTLTFETVKTAEDIPLDTWQTPWTCIYSTCEYTCKTCDAPTCPDTCPATCNTCAYTCACTVSCGPTCQDSCDYGRCPRTYWETCGDSCDPHQ